MTFSTTELQEYKGLLESVKKYLSIPDGYKLKNAKNQKQNGNQVWIYRYERMSGENNGIGGEHFSFVVDKNNHKILGFTWMDQSLSTGKLPNKEETRTIAKAFLNKVEPGLFEKLENRWIDYHDEPITVVNREKTETVTISGMKYKCYQREKDDYAWVIVGSGGKVISFEQGIIWNNGRVTEKWLHDSWLKKQLTIINNVN